MRNVYRRNRPSVLGPALLRECLLCSEGSGKENRTAAITRERDVYSVPVAAILFSLVGRAGGCCGNGRSGEGYNRNSAFLFKGIRR